MPTPAGRPRWARTWLLATGALLALHFGQEMVELTLNGVGPAEPVAANGALLVLPLAALAALFVALGLRGAAPRAVHRRRPCSAPAPRARAARLARPRFRRCAPRPRRSRCTSPSALRRLAA